MKVVSVNTGEKRTFKWRGNDVETGIFKFPVSGAVQLGIEDVVDDYVIERKYHGGIDKACYIYSADHYPYWKNLYPNLNFHYGMFGENITIEGLDESRMFIGDTYEVGSAIVEVSQPREPCYKLGARFETQKILKQFVNSPYPGVYLRVIKVGKVIAGDKMNLIEKGYDFANLKEVYHLLYHSESKDEKAIIKILDIENLSSGFKGGLEKRLKFIQK